MNSVKTAYLQGHQPGRTFLFGGHFVAIPMLIFHEMEISQGVVHKQSKQSK